MATRISLVGLAMLAGAAPALAFDCGKARTTVEKAICASPVLRSKDDALNAAYQEVKALSTPAERKMLAQSQKQWITGREQACGDAKGDELSACIGDQIDGRLKQFKAAPEAGPGTGKRMMPVFVAQEGSGTHYTVAYNLLRFADAQTAGEKTFNGLVAGIAAKAPLGRRQGGSGDRILESDSELTITYAAPNLISAQNSYWSDDGGAHGNGGVSNLNVDLARGKELEIGDILPEAAAKTLAKDCKAQIIKQKAEQADQPYDPATDTFLSDEVINEHIATLSRWSFGEVQATVTFDAYAIGAYSEGTYECNFAMKELKAAALPGAPLP